MPNQGSEWRHSPCQDQSEPPSVSFTIYLLLSIFLASWPLAIKRVGGSRIYRKSDNTVNSQNDQSPSVDHTHADTRLCRPQTYVWHGNLHVRHERYEMHGFSIFNHLQAMQGSVRNKPHCGMQVQPRLLPQVHQVSWTRLPQRTRRQEFLHLASLQKIEAPSSITAWTQIPYYYLQICSLVFVFTHFYLSPNIIWWPYLDHLFPLVGWVRSVLPEDDLPVSLRGPEHAVGRRHEVSGGHEAAGAVVLGPPSSSASLPKTRDFSNMLQTITVTWFEVFFYTNVTSSEK